VSFTASPVLRSDTMSRWIVGAVPLQLAVQAVVVRSTLKPAAWIALTGVDRSGTGDRSRAPWAHAQSLLSLDVSLEPQPTTKPVTRHKYQLSATALRARDRATGAGDALVSSAPGIECVLALSVPGFQLLQHRRTLG
jgi:hypothetical protein